MKKDSIIPAKTCYDHIGGKLGELLLKAFIANKWIKKDPHKDKSYLVTETGKEGFETLGIDLSLIKPEKTMAG
jgi:hypothetical protein